MSLQKIADLEKQLNQIKKTLEELKTQEKEKLHNFKDGDWLQFNSCGESYVFKYKDMGNNVFGAYLAIKRISNGLIDLVENVYNVAFFSEEKFTLATKEQVQEVILLFADIKGYRVGVTIKSMHLPHKVTIKDDFCLNERIGSATKPSFFRFHHYDEYDLLNRDLNVLNNNIRIYEDKTAQWAEIVKEYEIIPGYKVTYVDKDCCMIDDRIYLETHIRGLIEALEKINKFRIPHTPIISSINVGCNGQYKLTVENLKELLSKWPLVY